MTTQAPYPAQAIAEFEVIAKTHDEAMATARLILDRFDPDGSWTIRARFSPNTEAYGDDGPLLWSADIEAVRRTT